MTKIKSPQSILKELKPFHFKQGYFQNSTEEEEFHEFLTMTNMIAPKDRTPIMRKRKIERFIFKRRVGRIGLYHFP